MITTTNRKRAASSLTNENSATCFMRGKTPVTKFGFVLLLHLIGWEGGTSFLDQSKDEVKQTQSSPGSLTILSWKMLQATATTSVGFLPEDFTLQWFFCLVKSPPLQEKIWPFFVDKYLINVYVTAEASAKRRCFSIHLETSKMLCLYPRVSLCKPIEMSYSASS